MSKNIKKGVTAVVSKIYKNLSLEDLENEIWTDALGFDGIYAVRITPHGVVFDFKKLLWENYGHNQFPAKTAKVSDYGFICNDYKNQNGDRRLCVVGDREYLYSNYFEVVGNKYENPELLEQTK